MEELYDMAIACTQTDGKGNITVLGYPLFPLAAVPLEGVYAFGGRWAAQDGKTLTPNNQGALASMKMNLQYRQKFGMRNVQAFVSTANTNRYTPQDAFFAGREVFRFDGLWLTPMIQKYKPDLDYAITYIPGTKANPDARGSSRLETSSVAMSKVSKNKDGAFAFMKYYATKGVKGVLLATGGLPTYEALSQDKDILAQKDIGTFLDAMKLNKGVQFPPIQDASKYKSMINSAYDYVYNGSKTPEKALSDLERDSKSLK
jgi:multiple sugar transport system substrate-binding protein